MPTAPTPWLVSSAAKSHEKMSLFSGFLYKKFFVSGPILPMLLADWESILSTYLLPLLHQLSTPCHEFLVLAIQIRNNIQKPGHIWDMTEYRHPELGGHCDAHVFIFLPMGWQHSEGLAERHIPHTIPHIVIEVLCDIDRTLVCKERKKLSRSNYYPRKVCLNSLIAEGPVPDSPPDFVSFIVPGSLRPGGGKSDIVPGTLVTSHNDSNGSLTTD